MYTITTNITPPKARDVRKYDFDITELPAEAFKKPEPEDIIGARWAYPTLSRILNALRTARGRIVSREEIIFVIAMSQGREEPEGGYNILSVYIHALRKLGFQIKTHHSRGFSIATREQVPLGSQIYDPTTKIGAVVKGFGVLKAVE